MACLTVFCIQVYLQRNVYLALKWQQQLKENERQKQQQ